MLGLINDLAVIENGISGEVASSSLEMANTTHWNFKHIFKVTFKIILK